MSDNGSVKHYRKLIGGGAVAYVRHGETWVWRFRPGSRALDDDLHTHDDYNHFPSPEAFAKNMGFEVDQEDHDLYMIKQRPVPRRREAILATRAATKRTENIVSNE